MNEIELGREKLRTTMIDYCTNLVKNELSFSNEEVFVSPKFEQKMQKLIKRRKNSLWKYVNTPIKRFVAACLVIIILCSMLMSFRSIREPVVEFFVNVYEKYTELFSVDSGNSTSEIEDIKTFAYVPEGYELKSTTNNDISVTTIWKNSDSKIIELNQGIKSGSVTLDTEDSEYGILNNNGVEIFYSFKNGLSLYYWVDGSYDYSIICYDEISTEEIIKMIDSLK